MIQTKTTEGSIRFTDPVDESELRFAVVVAKTGNCFVLCRHKDRKTWEMPGGKRKEGETICETAKRELFEETGAVSYVLEPVGSYCSQAENSFGGVPTFGMLFAARIERFEEKLLHEIAELRITEVLPENRTYPGITEEVIAKAEPAFRTMEAKKSEQAKEKQL